LLARLEDPSVAVLGEAVEGLRERLGIHVGLFLDLAEVGLAVDELQDLHQVPREGGRLLVDLRDALRGLGVNRRSIHRFPGACSRDFAGNDGMKGACLKNAPVPRPRTTPAVYGPRIASPCKSLSSGAPASALRGHLQPNNGFARIKKATMRSTALALAAACAALSLCASAQDPPARVGRISYVEGPTSVYQDADAGWQEALLNTPLTSENSVWTDRSARAEVQVSASAIRLSSMT